MGCGVGLSQTPTWIFSKTECRREAVERGNRPTATVLAALQGRPSDGEVLLIACEVARRRNAEVRTLHVLEVPQALPLSSWDEAAEARARSVLAEASERVASSGCRAQGRVLPTRHAGQAILDEAAELPADVIVLAKPYPARSGDAASYVLDRAFCEVLLWQTRREEQRPGPRETRRG